MSTTANANSAEAPILYTIGHSNLSPDEFLDILRQHEITTLVDVRSRPVSRYVPHFNKDKLAVFLEKHSIHYRFAGRHLGGQPDDPAVYKSGVVPDATAKREHFRKDIQYEAVMQSEWYQTGLHHLLEIVKQAQNEDNKVAIMCSEGDPHQCHRHHLITRSILDPKVGLVNVSIKVIHITRDGKIETADPAEFDPPPDSIAQQLSLL